MGLDSIKGKYEQVLDCYWFGTERLYGTRSVYGSGVGCTGSGYQVKVPSAGKYTIVLCLTGVSGQTSSSVVGIYMTYNGAEHQLYRGTDIDLSNDYDDSWHKAITIDTTGPSSISFEFKVITQKGSIMTRLFSVGVVRIA